MDETRSNNDPEQGEPQMLVNEYGSTRDSAVVVEEADRTVLLTDSETIIIPKTEEIDIVPKDRPRKVYLGMWGPTELITFAGAALAVFAVVMFYLFMVVPSETELKQVREQRDKLELDAVSARAKYGDITNTETQVSRLIESVDNFETLYLPASENGRTALYQRINGLIAAYGLVNTSGPDYAPLEIADERRSSSEDSRGRSRFQSLFPGVYVTMTVEGSYQNLRRFLREIETGKEFVIVSTVEIEPTEGGGRQPATQTSTASADQDGPPGGQTAAQGPQRPRGRTVGSTVSLRLEMAAYFRRSNAAAAETGVQQQ